MGSSNMIFSTLFIVALIISTSTSSADFINDKCKDSTYPPICYTTLSPYASSINNSMGLLVQKSISIGFNESEAVFSRVTRFNTSTPVSKEVALVLNECIANLTLALNYARDAMKGINEIVENNASAHPDRGNQVKLAYVQMNISKATSSQMRCVEGFKGVPEGSVSTDVIEAAKTATRATEIGADLSYNYYWNYTN